MPYMKSRPDLRGVIALIAILALSLALLLGAGCTSDEGEEESTESEAAEEEEAAEDEAVEDEAVGEETEDDAGTADEGMSSGEQLVQERCTVCHDLTRVEAADYDRAGWEASVDRMIQNGAQLTPEERDAVVDFLAAGG
jgi:cytochrome c5